MKKIAILVEDQYQDLEVWYPALRLKEAGFMPVFIAPQADEVYVGKYGYPLTSEEGISEVIVDNYEAVVIPGGFAPDYMRRTPAMVEFVKEMHSAGKVVAAICHGGWMLASADIVKDKNVTSFFAIRVDLENAGANWSDEEVVVDGNIITSRKPDDLPAFCKAILKTLG